MPRSMQCCAAFLFLAPMQRKDDSWQLSINNFSFLLRKLLHFRSVSKIDHELLAMPAGEHMKNTIFAATLLAASLTTAGATNISSPAETLTRTVGKNSVSFGNTFEHAKADDLFSDRFYFTLRGESDLTLNVTSTRASKDTELTLTGFSLFNTDTNVAVTGKQVLTGAKEWWKLTANDVVAGHYYLAVTGKTLGAGGSFGANGVIEVSPVPEPGTTAMLLGGLAVLGVAARRRRN
jgi:hypothetical protein